MIQRAFVKKNMYQDSVKLMRLTEQIKAVPGVIRASAIMGTENNKATIARAGFSSALMEKAGPNDILFLVEAEKDEDGQRAWVEYQAALDEHSRNETPATSTAASIRGARLLLEEANLALISVPGDYAAYEAFKALREGMHVHIFSDNVALEHEIKLKKTGLQNGLLVMGPDCGTSIINDVPICFANVVGSGDIGIVGASGTGIQQVSVLIDKLGAGVSHAIGVGGRDLSDAVGGITSLMALDLLEDDSKTKVIVLVSKPPGTETLKAMLAKVQKLSKPVVLAFSGQDSASLGGAEHVAATLEEAAVIAVSLAEGKDYKDRLNMRSDILEELGERLSNKVSATRKYVRALYSGGSLAGEALNILKKYVDDVEFNPQPKCTVHAVVDLGGDEFTQGRPHPMIDPSYRAERLVEEWANPEVGVILIDVVLGYGSHNNPAAPLAEAIRSARDMYGDTVTVIASVCGTDKDPQGLSTQEDLLKEAGVLIFPTNAYAADVAGQVARYRLERSAM